MRDDDYYDGMFNKLGIDPYLRDDDMSFSMKQVAHGHQKNLPFVPNRDHGWRKLTTDIFHPNMVLLRPFGQPPHLISYHRIAGRIGNQLVREETRQLYVRLGLIPNEHEIGYYDRIAKEVPAEVRDVTYFREHSYIELEGGNEVLLDVRWKEFVETLPAEKLILHFTKEQLLEIWEEKKLHESGQSCFDYQESLEARLDFYESLAVHVDKRLLETQKEMSKQRQKKEETNDE